MIQDRVIVTKPTRVQISVDRDDNTVKKAAIVDEVLAEWWVPEDEELSLPAFIEHGVRNQGWKLTRHKADHVVPEVEGAVGGPNWHATSDRIAEMLRAGDVQGALDLHEIASLQQAMVDEPEAHPHTFEPGEDGTVSPDAVCTFDGCRVRQRDSFGDFTQEP